MTDSVHTGRYQRLCWLLVEARKSKGLSQESLAQILGRVQTFVSKYERGERRLDLVEFLDVAAALGLDVRKVLRELESIDA
jgi:transcriptional regulator with XRE-family HTH domain